MNGYLKRLEREQSISGILSIRPMTRIALMISDMKNVGGSTHWFRL